MNQQTLAKAVREAGMITRCHTVPHHGSYSVAEHCFNALSLLLILYPGPPKASLIEAVLWHDVAERWTGDIPGPMKYISPELDDMVTEVENKCFRFLDIVVKLTEEEYKWLRAIDKVELWLWSADQLAMGNQNAGEIQRTLYDLFMTGEIPLPEECQQFVKEYRWSRLSDMPPTGE